MEKLQQLRNQVVALGLPCELLGKWLWVTGDTLKHSRELKALGFKWSRKQQAWYFAGCPRSTSDKEYTLPEIRELYSPKVVLL